MDKRKSILLSELKADEVAVCRSCGTAYLASMDDCPRCSDKEKEGNPGGLTCEDCGKTFPRDKWGDGSAHPPGFEEGSLICPGCGDIRSASD